MCSFQPSDYFRLKNTLNLKIFRDIKWKIMLCILECKFCNIFVTGILFPIIWKMWFKDICTKMNSHFDLINLLLLIVTNRDFCRCSNRPTINLLIKKLFEVWLTGELWTMKKVAHLLVNLCIFNPLTLTAAKTGRTILMKSFSLKHHWQTIWRRNVDQNITNNSPSNIL